MGKLLNIETRIREITRNMKVYVDYLKDLEESVDLSHTAHFCHYVNQLDNNLMRLNSILDESF